MKSLELEINSIIKKYQRLVYGIHDFNTRTNKVKDEKGDLVTDFPQILVTCWRVIKDGVSQGPILIFLIFILTTSVIAQKLLMEIKPNFTCKLY